MKLPCRLHEPQVPSPWPKLTPPVGVDWVNRSTEETTWGCLILLSEQGMQDVDKNNEQSYLTKFPCHRHLYPIMGTDL